ncbi:MAG: hypothetical protein RIR68_2489 [Pseudomonadota bacterium]
MRLLLVEDDPYLQENLVRSLSRRGLQVTSASTAAQAVSVWQSLRPDVVLLDLTLPDGDGLNVVSQVRQMGFTTPVLVLTARATVGDRVLGLNSGADDYMAKPFDLDELEARLNALYRRTKTAQKTLLSQGDTGQARNGLQTLQLGAVSLDTLNGVAYLHQQAMELTPREVAMLQALMAHAGQAVHRSGGVSTAQKVDRHRHQLGDPARSGLFVKDSELIDVVARQNVDAPSVIAGHFVARVVVGGLECLEPLRRSIERIRCGLRPQLASLRQNHQ